MTSGLQSWTDESTAATRTPSVDESPTPQAAPPKPRHVGRWGLDDVGYDRIQHDLIVGREDLFYLLASASFIETGSDMYTANLAAHYADHPGVADWLRDNWEHEELQHGKSLEMYVRAAWPAFDWQAAFDSFFAEYSALCTMEALESDRTLEMVARCVVEMGTTVYYQTLRDLSPEPVLTKLLGNIRADEVGHYKHFLSYFKQMREVRGVSRVRVARVLIKRVLELRSSDSDVALRHVWAHRGNIFPEGSQNFDTISTQVYELVSKGLPADQAVRMLLKPLVLPHKLEKWLESPLSRLARRAIAA